MSTDMTKDVFKEYGYGKAALKKIGIVTKDFRLYYFSMQQGGGMLCKGAEFRKAKSGKLKGVLSIMIKGTIKSVYINQKEIMAENKENGK